MTVFRNYFKILKKYLGIISMYTIILLVFTVSITLQNAGNGASSFTAQKPKVSIINLDKESKIIENFMNYMEKNTEIIQIENEKQKLEDALFYQNISAIVYIPQGYTEKFLQGEEIKIEAKYGQAASSSYANMILERYLKIADIANSTLTNEENVLTSISKALEEESKVEVQSTLDTQGLSKASFFYNFSNYSLLSICIYIISILLFRFNNEKVKKRNLVSSKKYSSITKELYLGNIVFGIIVWFALVILSFILMGEIMFSMNGILFMINSFVFMLCALSIGFLIGNILHSENAISAVVNIVGLGSSFITGCFLPVEFLPESVVNFSKILPSYWYIHNNEIIKGIETFNSGNIGELILNMGIVLAFTIFFMILANFLGKRKK